MKGMLMKDLCILKQRKQSLLIFVGVCLIMSFSMDSSFVVGYMCFLSAIMANSTIAYDDADNGMLFLMTLPVERKTYALSKYVLGGLFAAAAWVLALVIVIVMGLFRGGVPDDLASSLIFIPASMLMLDLLMPIQLKYGPEKGRTVMFILFGAISAILLLGNRVFLKGEAGAALLDRLSRIPGSTALGVFLVIFILLTLVSCRISRRIMEKKTF